MEEYTTMLQEWLSTDHTDNVEDDENILDLARERTSYYALSRKIQWKKKIETRKEFVNRATNDIEWFTKTLNAVLHASAPIPRAIHITAVGEGALAETTLYEMEKITSKDEVANTLSEALGVAVEARNNGIVKGYEVNWTILATVWKELKGIPPGHCPLCKKPVKGKKCELCGEKRVRPGLLLVDEKTLYRTIREIITKYTIPKKCSTANNDDEELALSLYPWITSNNTRRSNKRKLPPCIKLLEEKLEKGESLSHYERFTLCSFLVNIGEDIEKIVEMFSTLPDYDEERTRYQVRHIAGLEGSGTKYIPPNCDKLKIKGICPGEDCGVKNPLSYFYSKSDK